MIDRGMFDVLDLFIDPILMVRGFRKCLKVPKITLTTCLKARLMTRSFKSDDDMRRPLGILDRVFLTLCVPMASSNASASCKRMGGKLCYKLSRRWVWMLFFKSVKKA